MTDAVRDTRTPRRSAQESPAADSDSVDQYLHDLARYPLLTAEEETALGTRIRAGDEDAVAELVRRNLRFVVSIAKTYQHRGLPMGDLIGEGNVGLVTAARRFDPAQGVRFVSYAVWWIRQAIRVAVARQGSVVRLPPARLALMIRARRTADSLRQHEFREPTAREIAEAAQLPLDIVRTAAVPRVGDVSLDTSSRIDSDQSMLDRLCCDESPDSEEERDAPAVTGDVAAALAQLPGRNAMIVRLYFGLDGEREHTLGEIGELLGVTRERIRQLRDRALRQLRNGRAGATLRVHAGETDPGLVRRPPTPDGHSPDRRRREAESWCRSRGSRDTKLVSQQKAARMSP